MKLFLNPYAKCPKGWTNVHKVTDAICNIASGGVDEINFIAEFGYGPGLHFYFLEKEREALRDQTRSSIGDLTDYKIGAYQELRGFDGGSGDSVAFWIYLGAIHGLPKINCSFYETPTPTMSLYIRLAEKQWKDAVSS